MRQEEHSGVLCYNIIAYFGAGRELSVVAQACDLGRLMQEDYKLKAIPGNSVRWLNSKVLIAHAW